MKILALSALLLATPVSWYELETGDILSLAQDVHLEHAGHALPEGSAYRLIKKEPLSIPGAPMIYLGLEQAPCPQPEWESEMEIVVPRGNPERSAVGVELRPGCLLGIYVEQKDLFTSSLFSRETER